MTSSLLDPSFLTRLEQLQLTTRRILKGAKAGERRSRSRGQSVEFADFRNYSLGDDLRYLDWSLYARLERLFLKLYEEEQELQVTLFIDASESMNFGNPTKLQTAIQLAAAMGYIALSNFDAVGCVAFQEKTASLRLLRNKKNTPLLFKFLQEIQPAGKACLSDGIRRHASKVQRGGVAIIFSDLMEPDGIEKGLASLMGRHGEIHLFHILAQEELKPDFNGDFRLLDSENGSTVEVSFPRIRQAAYEQTVTSWCQSIQSFCTRRGLIYIPVHGPATVESIILRNLRSLGAVK